jgi:diguanylate cyclase (GGDEF)-like protein
VLALTAASVLLASLLGLLDYRQTQVLATVMGPLPMLLSMAAAVPLARLGNRTARMMMLGWGAYLVGALGMAGLLRGWLPADFWTQHLFQFATMAEMLAWMRVLSLRIEDVRRHAERTEAERHALHSLAHTDALTGLPNRRGLSLAMAQALQRCRADSGVAVYMLDLDGFKPINDRLGHDAGDTLLVQVAHRLRSLVRGADVVARLGGDEFVVMALDVKTEADARWVGRKLLDAFVQPFDVSGQRCKVGLTIGFALAPQDGNEAAQLLKLADAAMYAGKQAGRHCMRRAGTAELAGA